MDAGDVVDTRPKSNRFHPRQPKTFQIQHVFDLKRFECPDILAMLSFQNLSSRICLRAKNLFPFSPLSLPILGNYMSFSPFCFWISLRELKSLVLFLSFESDPCKWQILGACISLDFDCRVIEFETIKIFQNLSQCFCRIVHSTNRSK
jgi:hypothetical protein